MVQYIDLEDWPDTELSIPAEQTAAPSHFQQNPLPVESQKNNLLPPYIKHLRQCKLLICRTHGVCLTLKILLEHLENEHYMSVEKSRLIFRAARKLDVASTRSGIKIPPAEAPPIAGLHVDLGFMCTAEAGCPFLSPHKKSLNIHSSKHGNHHGRSACCQKVALQNFFPGMRPLYFVVNTSATPAGRIGESVSAWGAEFGPETISATSKDVDREDADEKNSSGPRLEKGLGRNMEPASSSALTRPLTAVNSQLTSQPALVSGPTLSLFSNTVFLTKRQDTGKIHICLASDIISPGSNVSVLDPSSVHFGSYCDLLRNEEILDQEGKVSLGFQSTGRERMPILNQMMFRTAVIYQVDRKVDIVTFSAAIAVLA